MRRLALAVLVVAAACGDDAPENEPLFPADYAATYQEVRDCRRSGGEHEINYVRVLADPDALGPYTDRTTPFPPGAVVLKEEYDFTDSTCAGDIVQWSVMVKLDQGADPMALDWTWQRVDAERAVVDVNTAACAGCHEGCGFPPDGYDGTCTVP